MRYQISQSHSGSKKDQQNSQPSKHTNNPLDFFRERGSCVVENEHGWLNYYVYEHGCYLENMYIYPESRKNQHGTMMLSNLELHLKEIIGAKTLFTTISRSHPDKDKNLQIALKRGFKFESSTSDVIILKKEL